MLELRRRLACRTLGIFRCALVALSATLATAGPAAAGTPKVTLQAPLEALLGQELRAEATFANAGPKDGFGPYVDLFLQATGADKNAANEKCDGITFAGVVPSVPALIHPAPPQPQPPEVYAPQIAVPLGSLLDCKSQPKIDKHPLTGLPLPSSLSGYQLYVVELQLGSFVPSEPPVQLDIRIFVSDYADEGQPLTIAARGGFRWGADELDNPGADPPIEGQLVTSQVVPRLFVPAKEYLGPEDETATGPSFPQRYRITVDVAAGQTITDLRVIERLAKKLQFKSLLQVEVNGKPVAAGAACPGAAYILESQPSLGGDLVLRFCSVTGTKAPDDVRITFEFFVPEKDADGKLILNPKTCAPVKILNDVEATGLWNPLDPRDQGANPRMVASQSQKPDHELWAKCVAIQKSVNVETETGAPGPAPGDTLAYTLKFQVSDYFKLGNLSVRDTLSDGQRFEPNKPTQLAGDGNFSLGNTLGVVRNYPPSKPCQATCPGPPCPSGTTRLTFNVSKQRVNAGLPATMQGQSGAITFRSVIEDSFHCSPAPLGDPKVDKHDKLTDQVEIQGKVVGGPSPGVVAKDTSAAETTIVAAEPKKSIFAIRRANGKLEKPPASLSASPGDAITFRFEYELPSCDAEKVRILDFLPKPALDVAEPVFGQPGWSWNGKFLCSKDPNGNPPPAGYAQLGPGNTAPWACQSGNPVQGFPVPNTLLFRPWTLHGANNKKCKVDVLYTLAVTCDPFADGLFLTNRAIETERNSLGEDFSQEAVAQFRYAAPDLALQKGVVSACCPGGRLWRTPVPPGGGDVDPPPPPPVPLCSPTGSFSPATVGPVPFSAPGSVCPRFTGTVTSSGLAGKPVGSDLASGVDPGNYVTFAIVVENQGSSPYGAFGVHVQDKLPLGAGFVKTNQGKAGINLCVTDGTGKPLPYTGGLSGNVLDLTLTDPGPLQGALAAGSATSGKNLVVVTYDLQIAPDAPALSCFANAAELAGHKANTKCPAIPGSGPGGGPSSGSAQVCLYPQAVKSIVASSEAHTVSGPQEPLAIGEIVRYRLKVRLPQGTTPFLRLSDLLPAGLALATQPGPQARVSFLASKPPSVAFDLAGAFNNAQPPTFPLPPARLATSVDASGRQRFIVDLGTVTNNDSDCDEEWAVVEINVQVLNAPENQDGAVKPNSFDLVIGKGDLTLSSNTVTARIVEPKLELTKTFQSGLMKPSVGDVVSWSVTFTNTGTATAFDVVVLDQLAKCLRLVQGTVKVETGGGAVGADFGDYDKKWNIFTATAQAVPVGGTVTLRFETQVTCTPSCENTSNRALLAWTSLPGSGTHPNPTGSVTSGDAGDADGERTGAGGINDYNAVALATIPRLCGPDLQIDKFCTEDHVLRCWITLTNVGGQPAVPPITLTETLPFGLHLTHYSGPGGQPDPAWSCTGNGAQPVETVSCTYSGSLAVGQSTTVRVQTGPMDTASQEYENCVKAQVAGDVNPWNDEDVCVRPCVPRPGIDYGVFFDFPGPRDCGGFGPEACGPGERFYQDPCGCACIAEEEAADLTLGKTCTSQGGLTVCTIRVKSLGPNPAHSIEIKDLLPPGLTFQSGGDGKTWTCHAEPGTGNVVCVYDPSAFLNPGDVTPPLTVTLSGTLPPAGNCAQVYGYVDVNPLNDLGCTTCPDPIDPKVEYLHDDLEICDMVFIACLEGGEAFYSRCGCGCRKP